MFPHGAVEIFENDSGQAFKVNGQRLKHYYGDTVNREVVAFCETPTVVPMSVVREFYANAKAEKNGFTVVRGMMVEYSTEAIRRAIEQPARKLEQENWNEKMPKEFNLDLKVATLCVPETHWKFKKGTNEYATFPASCNDRDYVDLGMVIHQDILKFLRGRGCSSRSFKLKFKAKMKVKSKSVVKTCIGRRLGGQTGLKRPFSGFGVVDCCVIVVHLQKRVLHKELKMAEPMGMVIIVASLMQSCVASRHLRASGPEKQALYHGRDSPSFGVLFDDVVVENTMAKLKSASERYSPLSFFFGVSVNALAINMLFIYRMVFNGNGLNVDEYVPRSVKNLLSSYGTRGYRSFTKKWEDAEEQGHSSNDILHAIAEWYGGKLDPKGLGYPYDHLPGGRPAPQAYAGGTVQASKAAWRAELGETGPSGSQQQQEEEAQGSVGMSSAQYTRLFRRMDAMHDIHSRFAQDLTHALGTAFRAT
ncbi:hypothetical protein AgCh_028900 [Apium graveolens]